MTEANAIIDPVEALARTRLLAGLPRAELAPLLRDGARRTHAAGERIFGELEPGDTIVVVLTGRVRICVAAGEPTEALLEEVGPGTALGEVGLLTGRVRSATALAVEPTEVLRLPREAVSDLMARFPCVAQVLASDLAARIADADRSLARALAREPDPLSQLSGGHRAGLAPRRRVRDLLAAAFREVVLHHRTELPFFFLSGFLTALVVARVAVLVGNRSGGDPAVLLRDLYVLGLLLLLGAGSCAHFIFARRPRRILCALCGAAIGFLSNELSVLLSFDVFYRDMTTRDPHAQFPVTQLYDQAATRYAVLIVVVLALQATYLRGFYRHLYFLVRQRLSRSVPPAQKRGDADRTAADPGRRT